MAYAALVSLAQTIDELQHHDQYSNISLHGKQQIVSIHELTIFLQGFLEDSPENANRLEGRIRDLANEAEDTVGDFMFSDHHNCVFMWLKRITSGIYMQVRLHFNFNELREVAREVREMKSRTRSIEDAQLIIDSSVAASSSSSSSRLAPTSKSAMVGFVDDLLAIKARLCGESSKLQVIPIVGMGGIGKTTLAKNAFDDPLIVEHFQICAWVTVSQDYSTQEILSSLLDSIKEFSDQRENRNESIEELVYKSLKGRRYLIVMDDIWSTKAWDDVRMIFPDDDNGSRIMLTTRLADVAVYPDSCSPLHEMRFLDADISWKLLQQKVFALENYPPELEAIGKMIARSCRGLPLAIVLIGGLLSTVTRTQASWENIARNINLAISTTNDEQFAKILSLSYINLPHRLRPCFLYMGSFPEDYEIRVSKLIKLWVAEGFLKPSESKSLEEGAEEYLEDLVKRNLVLVTERKTSGKIKSCSIHDLVRDLCIRKSQEQKFRLNVMDKYVCKVQPKSLKGQRRVSIAHSDMTCLENVYGSSIRTIICFHCRESSIRILGKFRLLRVLDVVITTDAYFFNPNWEYGKHGSLPIEVFELFHLRYLAINYEMKIPAAISNLQNLQTLIIYPSKASNRYLYYVVYFPLEIWRMPQLRHLVSVSSAVLPHPEGANFALGNLQTLEIIDFVCDQETLKIIPNLKSLGISYGDSYSYFKDYHLQNLVHLHQLEKLRLKVSRDFHRKLNPVFPKMLKKLTLSGWRLPWEDMDIVGLLPNLEVLKLRDHAGFGNKWETRDGEFPQLKFLLIDKSYLRHWITESSHFPSLKCLVLYNCKYLSEIPDSIGEIPTLEVIEVDDWNKSLVDSAKRIQDEQQENWGNDTLQVRSVRYKRRH